MQNYEELKMADGLNYVWKKYCFKNKFKISTASHSVQSKEYNSIYGLQLQIKINCKTDRYFIRTISCKLMQTRPT